ncbi:hypothetical protein [Ideonella oryzae]|uniref:Uncharacterized protein n=1 Tax=Ideonella oryzae TaxID=2937441 RepID=A0ABT1BSM8_9BURK|nr:hypothetical protein [Ideonella oryzae]MCO5978547.1 hypothetical protein [Ideonella oryzae]
MTTGAGPGLVRQPPPPSFVQRHLGWLKELPLVPLSQLSLLVGGLTLLAFFARVGFMPDLSLASALSLLYAVALLGLATLFALFVMLVLPSLLMRHGLPWPPGARPSGRLLLISTVLASLVWVGYFAVWAVAPATWHGGLGQAVTGLALAALLFWASLSLAPAARVARVPGLLAAMAFALQFAALSLPLVVVAPLAGGGQLAHASTWTAVTILVGLILLLAVTTTLRVFLWDRSLVAALALTMVELMLVVSATGSAGYLLDNVMARLQLGHVQPVRAVLTRSGCLQLNLAAGVPVCAVPAAADVPAAVCPLSIRLRIGAQVLLAPVAEAASEPDWQVVLERKELLAWSKVPQGCDAKMR